MSTSRWMVPEPTGWAVLSCAAAWTAVGFYFSTAGHDAWLLAWQAPVPILALAFWCAAIRKVEALRHKEAGGAAALPPNADGAAQGRCAAKPWLCRMGLAALLAGFAGNLAWVVLYRGILPMPALLVLAATLGAAFAACVLLTGVVAARRGTMAGVLVFPVLWVSVEFAFARLSPHGSAGSVAYSQVDVVPLIQVAAWAGLSGITFLVQFVAAGIAAAVGTGMGGRTRWPAVAVPAAVVLAVLALGQSRVTTATVEGKAAVGLAAIDDGMRSFEVTARDQAMPVVNAYLEAVHTLATRQVDAIVLPEKMVGVAPAYEEEVGGIFSAATDKEGVLLVAGLNLVGRRQPRNVAAVFSRGRKVLEYDKRRLVPGLEAQYVRGEAAGLYKAPGGLTAVAICKDMDFAELGREYGRAGVGLLFVPAWDFTRDARLHSRMAVMRGVEGGFSVARAAANGLLTGSDYLGQIVAERGSDEARQSMLLATLPLGRGRTFYAEHGDWFAWVCLVAAAGLIMRSLASGL